MVKYSSDIDKVVLRKLRSNFSKVNLIAVLRSSGSLVGNGLVNVQECVYRRCTGLVEV